MLSDHTCRQRTARSLVLLLLLIPTFAGCQGDDSSSTLSGDTTASAGSDSSAPPEPPPWTLRRTQAQQAVLAAAPGAPFKIARTCFQAKPNPDCVGKPFAEVDWMVGRVWFGNPLPDGNGLQGNVSVGVSKWPTIETAKQFATTQMKEIKLRKGRYDIKLKKTSATRYTPGERGDGTITKVTKNGWSGVSLRYRYLNFFDESVSGNVIAGWDIYRRDNYVLYIRWATGSPQMRIKLATTLKRAQRVIGSH